LYAPVLIAEVFLDAVVIPSTDLSARNMEERSWLESAFQQTGLTVTAFALSLVLIGVSFSFLAPNASTLREVIAARGWR
jgi:hypothetical protein